MKVQAGSFHLNGHIVGFRPQTQKLQSPFKTPSSTLAVKGLILSTKCSLRIQLPNIVGLLITTHHWINSQHISMMRSHKRHLYSQATETNNNAVCHDIQQLIVMTDERIRGELALKLNFVLFL